MKKQILIRRSIGLFLIFKTESGRINYKYTMSDFEELLPEDSVFSTSLSSHFLPPVDEHPVPPEIKVIDQCKVVVNTPECLTKLSPFFDKVSFPEGLD